MKITLNGKIAEIRNDMTIADLLRSKETDPARVVVERNLEILDKDKYGDTRIKEDDAIEIVCFMGGG